MKPRAPSIGGVLDMAALAALAQAAPDPDATGSPDEPPEPAEPDGEAFRGGESAAYSAEEQARIQRELK